MHAIDIGRDGHGTAHTNGDRQMRKYVVFSTCGNYHQSFYSSAPAETVRQHAMRVDKGVMNAFQIPSTNIKVHEVKQ